MNKTIKYTLFCVNFSIIFSSCVRSPQANTQTQGQTQNCSHEKCPPYRCSYSKKLSDRSEFFERRTQIIKRVDWSKAGERNNMVSYEKKRPSSKSSKSPKQVSSKPSSSKGSNRHSCDSGCTHKPKVVVVHKEKEVCKKDPDPKPEPKKKVVENRFKMDDMGPTTVHIGNAEY